MGPRESKQIAKQEIRAKTQREIEEIYQMFGQTIDVVKHSRIKISSASKKTAASNPTSSKITNINQVFEQLLESFKRNEKYHWGMDIYKQFKHHFTHCFEEIWPINKEDFYKLILAHCKFQTIDFETQLKEIASNKQFALPNRNSFQQFFYKVGAARLQEHLPSSFISEGEEESGIFIQSQEEKAQFNLNTINVAIINNQYNPEDYLQSHHQKMETAQEDFLPLFLNTKKGNKGKKPTNQQPQEKALAEKKKKQKLREAKIQNSSLLVPQTVFLNRLTETVKNEIGDLVRFYRQFGNALQMMFFSVSLISAPFKHFIYILTEKMNRKNITNRKHIKSTLPANNYNFTAYQKLLYGESKQALQFRATRQSNNNKILEEIRDFAQAYTQFIWMYLELNEITELKLGRLISIEALYGIVLKNVWKYVQFISDRGYEYQEWKIQQYYQNNDVQNRLQIPEDKRRYLLRILNVLKKERNPQKYLKQIVIFYREASNCGTCADDLLTLYQQLLVGLIKGKATKELGLFRMRNVIQKLLKIDQSYSGGGQIGYSWTTWCIVTELLKSRIKNMITVQIDLTHSNIVTEPDDQVYQIENLGIQ